MDDHELQQEAATMALYVAVVLLATLTVMSHRSLEEQPRVLVVVWGTTIGLALAHVFAFTVASARVMHDRPRRRLELVAAQMTGAALVAVVASVPVLFLPAANELDADRLLIAALIAGSGYRVSRGAGRSRGASLVVAGAVLAAGVAVAIAKNALGGH